MRVEVKRRMGEDDIAAVSKLLHEATVADQHRPLGEHQWLDLVEGGRSEFAGFVAWEPGHSHPVGYAQVSRGTGSWSVEFVVDPHHRSPQDAIGSNLLTAALEEVRHQGGGHVHLWVPKPTEAHDRIAIEAGLRPGRVLYQMRRRLPLTATQVDAELRAFRPGADEEAWLEVNNRSFAAHPEQGGWDMETLLKREREAWFDPEGFLLHERDRRLAAFCWTKIHHDQTPPLGEIYVIAVDPDFQGLGLGRQLAVAGLDWLARAELEEGMLYVDASNLPAVSLYKDLGFTVDHVDRAYVADIPPA